MRAKWLCICLTALMLFAVTASAATLPGGLDALSALAKGAKPTPFQLPDTFDIAYRTADGELALSRDENGHLKYVNGDNVTMYLKAGDDAYVASIANESGADTAKTITALTFDQVKEQIAPIWSLMAPNGENEHGAVTAEFDKNVKLLGRKANRFRSSIHSGDDKGYSVKADIIEWYTFDKETGVCLMKETGETSDHDKAQVAFECIRFESK